MPEFFIQPAVFLPKKKGGSLRTTLGKGGRRYEEGDQRCRRDQSRDAEWASLKCRYLDRLTSLFCFLADARKKDARTLEKPI